MQQRFVSLGKGAIQMQILLLLLSWIHVQGLDWDSRFYHLSDGMMLLWLCRWLISCFPFIHLFVSVLQLFDKLWDVLDQNGDGAIDYAEFRRAFVGEMNEYRKGYVRKVRPPNQGGGGGKATTGGGGVLDQNGQGEIWWTVLSSGGRLSVKWMNIVRDM